MHLPQDSVMQKSIKYFATSTMQELSSITIMPPDPIIEPALARDSYSTGMRSEEHTSELQSRRDLVCRLLLEKKKTEPKNINYSIRNKQTKHKHQQNLEQ